jgi:hypothetical protein
MNLTANYDKENGELWISDQSCSRLIYAGYVPSLKDPLISAMIEIGRAVLHTLEKEHER